MQGVGIKRRSSARAHVKKPLSQLSSSQVFTLNKFLLHRNPEKLKADLRNKMASYILQDTTFLVSDEPIRRYLGLQKETLHMWEPQTI